jgi:ribosome-interacting GTPase 1
VSEQHADTWVFDLIRYADLIWIVVDGERAIEGVDEARRVLELRNIGVYPPGTRPNYLNAAVQKKALVVVTKLDRPGVADAVPVLEELLESRWPVAAVSCLDGTGLEALKRTTFDAFEIIRVYTKQPGKPRDGSAPFALPRGATIGDLAERIHKGLLGTMTFARVWGRSAFDGQAVQKEHVLAEGDVVEIHE